MRYDRTWNNEFGVTFLFNHEELRVDIQYQLYDVIDKKYKGIDTITIKEINKHIDEWASHAKIVYSKMHEEYSIIWDNYNNCHTDWSAYVISIEDELYNNKIKYWLKVDNLIMYLHTIGINKIGRKDKIYNYNGGMYRIKKLFKLSDVTVAKLNITNKTDFTEEELKILSKKPDTIELL
jgi:hypothetical protein